MGSFWLLEMSQNLECSQQYISTPAWRSDPAFHTLRPRGVWTMGTITHNTHVIYGPLVHASGVHEG